MHPDSRVRRSPGLRVKYSTRKSCHLPSLFVGRFTYGFLSKKYGLWAAIATTTLKNISSMKQELLPDQILFIRKKKKRKRGNVRKKQGSSRHCSYHPPSDFQRHNVEIFYNEQSAIIFQLFVSSLLIKGRYTEMEYSKRSRFTDGE